MIEVKKFNRVEIEEFESGVRKGKFIAHARSKYGNGWMVPLKDMTPNDLRKLADYMEERGIGADQFGEDSGLCL